MPRLSAGHVDLVLVVHKGLRVGKRHVVSARARPWQRHELTTQRVGSREQRGSAAALQVERLLHEWSPRAVWNLTEEAHAGRIPEVFAVSDDPQRMVPLVWRAQDYMIAVSGDLLRTNGYVFAHNGHLGYPVGKKIVLPGNWDL